MYNNRLHRSVYDRNLGLRKRRRVSIHKMFGDTGFPIVIQLTVSLRLYSLVKFLGRVLDRVVKQYGVSYVTIN